VREWQTVTVALLEQQQRGGLADQHAAADHDCARAFRRDAMSVEHFEDAERRARPQARQPREQATGVLRVQAVGVLGRVDRLDHRRRLQRLRQRELHQDAVDVWVAVQRLDEVDDIFLRRVGGQVVFARRHPDAFARAALAFDV
jgi:hypothetical protein